MIGNNEEGSKLGEFALQLAKSYSLISLIPNTKIMKDLKEQKKKKKRLRLEKNLCIWWFVLRANHHAKTHSDDGSQARDS